MGGKSQKMPEILWFLRFFGNSAKISVIDIKCPSFGQMSIFWGLVFSKQLYIYVSNNLWNKKWGSLAVMGGSFFWGPLFKGARGGDPPTFSEFFFRQKLLNWHIWKVKRFWDFQIHRLRSTTRFPEGGAESAPPPPWEGGLRMFFSIGHSIAKYYFVHACCSAIVLSDLITK